MNVDVFPTALIEAYTRAGFYHELSARLGATLAGVGLERGDPVGILLPDGPTAHVAYVAAEKAGLVAIGIGPRAGVREIAHLLHETATTTLLTFERHRGHDTSQLVTELRTMVRRSPTTSRSIIEAIRSLRE